MLVNQFLSKLHFTSYEDFAKNLKIKVPKEFNYGFDVVDKIAETDPDKKALVWCDEDGNCVTLTFGDIKYYSDKTANYFRSLGIGKGDPVMLILKRRYQFWFCLVALHKLGAIAIPATHLLTKKDIIYRNNAADIKAIVSADEERVLKQIEAAESKSPSLKYKIVLDGDRPGWQNYQKALTEASPDFVRPTGEDATKNEDIMLLYFTSGTTGMPKMVQQNFIYPLAHILTAKFWQNVQDNGLHLTVADTGWAKAAWGKIYGQWICGTAVMVYDFERFDPHKMLEVIRDYKVTTFCAPPTVYRFLIKEDLTKYDFKHLKYCATAGEPLNPEVYNAFYKGTGQKLHEGFGQTETVVALATYPWLEPKPGSMGKPTPIYDIDLLNDKGESCEVGEEGQIVIRTNGNKPIGMFGGYYRDQKLTDKAWRGDVYYTGDTAWRDEDGYYWFVGRADDLIKTSGYRVGPFEVESALLEHPAVVECAVTGVPDPDRGQVIKATCVLSKEYQAGDDLVLELQDHVKKVTAPYKYPRIIVFVDELPKTISGKIRRVEIRKGSAD